MDAKQLGTLLVVTEAMAGELTDYLMDTDLYRQMIVKTPSGTKQPKMTLGSLLENVETLHFYQDTLTEDQRARLAAVDGIIDLNRKSFSRQWEDLLRRELKANVDSYKWYLEDMARREEALEDYGSEAHVRTRIEVIQRELAGNTAAAEERRELEKLDAQLRRMLHSDRYMGPKGEESRYPAEQAWWLYGSPASGEDQ